MIDLGSMLCTQPKRLRVLLVPDSVHWVTGTIAKSIVRFNPWIEGTILSSPVLDDLTRENPNLLAAFDLVHFICPYASKSWLPKLRDRLPCVTSHHHVTLWEHIAHNLHGDAIAVGSRAWEEDLSLRGAPMDRVVCIPYGVDAERFVPAPEASRLALRCELGFPKDAVVVGFFGKNTSSDGVDRKGTDVFARAIVRLKERLPGTCALIVGPGWSELVDAFRARGVHCVWFPFIRDEAGVRRMYGALDFYWVTARIEGGPLPLLEAMSSGVCCVSTPVGLAKELVQDGVNAASVPFDDAEGFADRTLALARDVAARVRLGTQARETILREMDIKVTTQKVRELYAMALETFARRQKRSLKPDVYTLASSEPETEEIPLHGVPARVRGRVRMMEDLAWSKHLILYGKQPQEGIKMIGKTWLRRPFSADPLRVLLQTLLPTVWVAKLVYLKHRFFPHRAGLEK